MPDRLAHHLKYSLRLIARSPVFALCAVASIAIGIGANTAIFTVANAMLLAPTPGVREPGRLVDIGRTSDGRGFDTVSYPTYVDLRAASDGLFENMFAIRLEPMPMSLGGDDGAAVVYTEQVSASYFDVLGLVPSAGTFFRTEEENLATPLRKIVLSYGFWQRRFARDPAVVGRTVVLNGTPFAVVGVGPHGFHGTTILAPDLWIPATSYIRGTASEESLRRRDHVSYLMAARLKPGVSVAQADSHVRAVMQRLAETYPEPYRGRGLKAVPSSRLPGDAGEAVVPFLLALFAIVGLVLLVACTNLAGLLLARAASRSREIAVRLALGASRRSLAGLLLTESLVLFGLGAVTGLALARVLTSLIVSGLGAAPFAIELDLSIDWRVAMFCTTLALVTGVLTGLGPALQSTRAGLVPDLKADTSAPRSQRLRHVFLTGQMAFCLVLVLVAGLFLRALSKASQVDPGFDVNGVAIASVNLAHGGYAEERLPAVADEVRARLSAIPGVDAVGVGAMIPFEGGGMGLGALRHPGTSGFDARFSETDWNVVSPEYLPTIGLPLVSGRNFTAADRTGAPRVAIVNELLARTAWPGENPVGQVLENGDFRPGREGTVRSLTVIGVARDSKYRWLGEAPRPFIYVPLAQSPFGRAHFFLRHQRAAEAGLQTGVRRVLRDYDANLPLIRLQPLTDYASLSLLPQRLAASIAGSLGTVALLLAAIGLYGVMAYAVASRRREIGIRMALGADAPGVMRLMLGRGLKLVAIGGVLGLAAALGVAQLMSSFLFGVSPLDPVTYAVTIGLLAAVALAAIYVPARRASRIDPLGALRTE
jgi:predicted permease